MKDNNNKMNKKRLVEMEYEIYHLIEDIKTISQYCTSVGKDIENLNQRLLELEGFIASIKPAEDMVKMENIQEDNE